MHKVSTAGLWFAAGAIVVGGMVFSGEALARKEYKEGFEKAYPALAAQIKEANCNVCHVGKSKKDRNDYGKAVGEALGEKNVKDGDKIAEALKKAGEAKDASGKTFAAVIEGGSLPVK